MSPVLNSRVRDLIGPRLDAGPEAIALEGIVMEWSA